MAIPVFKQTLSKTESARVSISLRNSHENNFFVAPHGLDIDYYRNLWPDVQFRFFPKRHFESTTTYSDWLLSPEIYREFRDFQFLLICQTDAILLKPIPKNFDPNWDYIGAVWVQPFHLSWDPIKGTLRIGNGRYINRSVSVGNGGLSIRRVSKFRFASILIPRLRNRLNEDQVWSFFGPFVGLRIASSEEAKWFFIETQASNLDAASPLPSTFGVHGLEKFNPALERKLLDSFGYGSANGYT